MDLGHVKQIFCKQGEVRRILEGDVVLWEKERHFSGKVVLIPSDTGTITDFAVGKYLEIMFKTDDDAPTWSISELPAGLTSEVTSEGLKIAGYPTETGITEAEVSTGTHSQFFIFDIENAEEVEYGIRITTSNEYPVTDFEFNKFGSKTFEASFYVPEEEQDSPVEWSFPNPPSGLSASGATLSGTATTKISRGVEVIVTKGSYRAYKHFDFRIYGLEITTISLPSGQQGTSYRATLGVSKHLPSGVGKLTYYASNLHAGLSLNSSTGVISGTPTAWGDKTISAYAVQSPYQSATKQLSLSIAAPPPSFTAPDSVINLSAYTCRRNSSEGSTVGTLNIYGYGFTQCGYILSKGAGIASSVIDVTLNGGDSSVNLPVVTVSTNVVNDNQLILNFVLKKNSSATESALKSRAKTIITVQMYEAGNSSNIIGRHTVGIGFE